MSQPKAEPLVYIVILNWNGWQDTINCVKSLSLVPYPNFVTLVVDNASINESVKKIKAAFPTLDVLELEENFGFAGGSNRGIQHALDHDADYVLLLNNDVIVDPPFLGTMVDLMENDPGVGALNPKIYYLEHSQSNRLWAVGGKTNLWLANSGNRGRDQVDIGQFEDTVELDFGTGCCLLIKREALAQTGLLDESYFVYFEDVDWSYRLRKRKMTVKYTPKAKVWHAVNASSRIPDSGEGTLSPFIHFLVARNQLWFVRTYTSYLQKSIAYPAYFVRRIMFYTGAFIVLRRWSKLRELWRGFLAGIRSKPSFEGS